MNLRTLRAKLAALAVLFFLGTSAGQLNNLLDKVRGRVEAGTRITEEVRGTVGQAADAASNAVDAASNAVGVVSDLTNQIADLQTKLAAGTATPAQVSQLAGLVQRLRDSAARPGTPGPPGPTGAPGPPGTTATTSPAPSSSTSTTARPVTTTTTRPASSTTTTTRCVAGVGQLIRIGC